MEFPKRKQFGKKIENNEKDKPTYGELNQIVFDAKSIMWIAHTQYACWHNI